MDEQYPRHDLEPRWPTQDGVDRSDDFDIIAVLTGSPEQWARMEELRHGDIEAWRELVIATKNESWRHGAEFQQVLDLAVAESVQEVLGDSAIQVAPSTHYQIGPAAEGVPTYLVHLWNQAQDLAPILSAAADAWAVTELTLRVAQKLQQWAQRRGLRYTAPSLILTPYQLAKLCEEHVRRKYHPRARLSVEWFPTTTKFWGGYSSPSHPTSSVEYLVTVKAGRKTYTYAVDGTGRVTAHHLREGARTVALPNPSLLAPNGQCSHN